MAQVPKHTPVPYAIGKNGFENHVITNGIDKIILTLDPNGSLSDEENLANAEFIVRACNSYADMVAVLVEVANHLLEKQDMSRCREFARDALKKAEIQ